MRLLNVTKLEGDHLTIKGGGIQKRHLPIHDGYGPYFSPSPSSSCFTFGRFGTMSGLKLKFQPTQITKTPSKKKTTTKPSTPERSNNDEASSTDEEAFVKAVFV